MLSGKLILFVDDEAGIRVLAARALAASGCIPHCAANGKEAIAILESQPIDAMVVDLIMPEKEGVETIMEVKARWPNLKVIAISGGGRVGPDDFLRLAGMIGADATMKKPLNFREMIATIGGLLNPIAA